MDLVQQMQSKARAEGRPLPFSKPPHVSTWKKVMREKEMTERVVFHRMVDIGRCSLCTYIQWKCSTVPPCLRPVWQNAMAKHQWIQMSQKRCYAKDRAVAATDYPLTEIYLAFLTEKLISQSENLPGRVRASLPLQESTMDVS